MNDDIAIFCGETQKASSHNPPEIRRWQNQKPKDLIKK